MKPQGWKTQNLRVIPFCKKKIEDVKAEFKRLAKKEVPESKLWNRNAPVEKMEEAIEKITEKIKAFRLQMSTETLAKRLLWVQVSFLYVFSYIWLLIDNWCISKIIISIHGLWFIGL